MTSYPSPMPTGPKHHRFTEAADGSDDSYAEDCRCTIGQDHDDDGGETEFGGLGESDAEAIWLSSGLDEDYDFR